MEITLPEKLRDLAQRITTACSRPDERPTFVHWSDAQILVQAAEQLETRERQVGVLAGGAS